MRVNKNERNKLHYKFIRKSTSTPPQHTVNYTSRELNEEKILIVAIRYIISEDIVQFIYIVIVNIQQKK